MHVEYVHGLVMRDESGHPDFARLPIIDPPQVVGRQHEPRRSRSASTPTIEVASSDPDARSRQREPGKRTPTTAVRRSQSASNATIKVASSDPDDRSRQREPGPRTSTTGVRRSQSASNPNATIEGAVGGKARPSRKTGSRQPLEQQSIRKLTCIVCKNEFGIVLEPNMPRIRNFVCSNECATANNSSEEEED